MDQIRYRVIHISKFMVYHSPILIIYQSFVIWMYFILWSTISLYQSQITLRTRKPTGNRQLQSPTLSYIKGNRLPQCTRSFCWCVRPTYFSSFAGSYTPRQFWLPSWNWLLDWSRYKRNYCFWLAFFQWITLFRNQSINVALCHIAIKLSLNFPLKRVNP